MIRIMAKIVRRTFKMKGNVCLAAEKYESLSPGTDCRSGLNGEEFRILEGEK